MGSLVINGAGVCELGVTNNSHAMCVCLERAHMCYLPWCVKVCLWRDGEQMGDNQPVIVNDEAHRFLSLGI